MLFVLTTDATVELVPSTDPHVKIAAAFAHLPTDVTTLIPVECCDAVHGAPRFECRALNAIEWAELTTAIDGDDDGIAQNKAITQRGLVKLDGAPVDIDKLTPGALFIVARAIVTLTRSPSAFLRPTPPAA